MEPDGIKPFGRPSARHPFGAPGADDTPPPVSIPDHVLVRRIGAGSYGEVWLARHTMGMLRAVKIVYRSSFQDQRPFERELSGIRRFEPLSRSYEGFVDVLHVGINEPAGYFYYLMELGDDTLSGQEINPETYAPKTLGEEILRKGRLSLQECLGLGLALSQALAELHKHNLVHRDVKPANIIYVNGVPKLADIGLVADLQEARSYVGTEGFIPPEGPGSPSADVYSLGKVLYEACTGKDRKDFPSLPEWWGSSPEHEALAELNEVILQACANEAAKRYESAREMHAELVLVENGKSVRRLRTLERRAAQLKRAAGVLAVVLLVVGALAFEAYQQWRRKLETRERQVGQDLAYGNRALEAGDFTGALPYFAEGLRLEAGRPNQERAYRLRLGSTLAQCPKLTHTWWLGRELDSAQFSPDGRRLLVAEDSGQARLYDVATAPLGGQSFGPTHWLNGASFSADGRWIVTTGTGGEVAIWDAASLTMKQLLPQPAQLLSARFSSNGQWVVTACWDGWARVWEWSTGRLSLKLQHNTNAVFFAAFSPDDRWIVTCGDDRTARLWDAATGHAHGTPLPHNSRVQFACFSPDGRRLATACADHKAYVWEISSGHLIQPTLVHGDLVRTIEYSPDGRLLLTASFDGAVRLWRADNLQPWEANPILKQGERLTSASFSPDGRCLVASGIEGTLRVWDLAGGLVSPLALGGGCSAEGSRVIEGTNGLFEVWAAGQAEGNPPLLRFPGAERAELNRNGRFVTTLRVTQRTASETNRVLEVWDVSGARTMAAGLAWPATATQFVLSDDGTRVVTFGGRTAEVWQVSTRTALCAPLIHDSRVAGACFSPDGQRLATRSAQQVRVWALDSGQILFAPLKHPVEVSSVEFSPNGQLLVSACTDQSLERRFAQVWDSRTGERVGVPLQHGDGVLQAAFSPDGNRIATASEDYTAEIWEALTGHQLTPPLRHQNQVCAAHFSQDGQWLVTGGADGAARLWSAETGDPLSPPLWHDHTVVAVKLLAGGQQLFTRDSHGQAWLWSLPVDSRPVEELEMLARLLSGGGVASTTPRFAVTQGEKLVSLWQELRRKHPTDFSISPSDIATWYAYEAQQSEWDRDWPAEVFHLEHLQALRPNDATVAERLIRVRKQLAESKAVSAGAP